MQIKLSKATAIFWLVITFLPIILLPLSMSFMSANDLDNPSNDPSQNFDFMFNIGIGINIFILVLIISYVVYMFVTPHVPRDKRALWLVIILFVNVMALPFFWYWYVWSPISISNESKSSKFLNKKNIFPLAIGLLMFSIIPIAMILIGYKQGHAYEYLANAYPLNNGNDELMKISSDRISISRRQNSGMSAIYLSDALNVYTNKSTIKFTSEYLNSFLYHSFEIPFEKIHSCSRQCGGSTDYLIILNEINTQISIEDAPELIEWCWENDLPILSSSARREWLYSGAALPEKSELRETLADKETYDYYAKQACLGY